MVEHGRVEPTLTSWIEPEDYDSMEDILEMHVLRVQFQNSLGEAEVRIPTQSFPICGSAVNLESCDQNSFNQTHIGVDKNKLCFMKLCFS